MRVGYYILCLVLMLPLAAVTAFAAPIESMVTFGFWKTLVLGLGMLFDPLGDGIRVDAAIPGMLVSPRGTGWGLMWLLPPSIGGFGLSMYCAIRSFREVTV